jgi:ABC-2 type transport system permease protein
MDSVYGTEARQTADSLLMARVLDAYLVFPPSFVNSGDMEYHSHKSAAFLETTRLEKILQNIIIDRRMANDNIERIKIRRWLKPINIRRYQLEAGTTREWNFYAQFYGPLIAVFLLFIAIFTSGGYLFSSVLLEKSNKILEQLLSSTRSGILLAGKFIGFGCLGLVQILLWLILLFLVQYSGYLPADQVSYLTLNNLALFILYFVLGYLLFGGFFILLGTISPTVYDAQQYNQSLRTIAILPALLSLLVFTNPEGQLISILSYIPPLSPSFMIMRIPLSPQSLSSDIMITIALLLVSGIIIMLLAASSFKNLVLLQGRKPTLSEWWNAVKFF